MKVSFKSRKLKGSVRRISNKAKNLDLNLDELQVFGVSKEDGVTVTGKDIGKDLGQYFYFSGKKFAYNPYRVNIGSIGLSDENFEGLMSPAYIIFEVDETIYPEFLLLYLKSNVGLKLIRWYGDRGGVRSSLRITDLEKIDFPDISYEDQKAFFRGYQKKEEKVESLLKELDHQETLLTQLRQSILQDAIQGNLTAEWRKQNSDIEPASELLKRIKAENEQLIKEKKIKKEKPFPKIKADEIPFEIPENWEWCRLGNVCTLKHGYAFKSKFFSNNPTDYILMTPGNFYESGGFRDRPEKRKYYDGPIDSQYVLKPEDFIIPMTEQAVGLLGSPAIIPDDGKVYLHNQRLGKIESPTNHVAKLYIYNFFNSRFFREELTNSSTGMKVKHTSPSKVLGVLFPLCPFEEQKVIVEKLVKFESNFDKVILEIQNGKRKAELLQKSILTELLGKENTLSPSPQKENKATIQSREIIYDSKTTLMELEALLKKHGRLHAEDLWKMSQFPEDIDKFYAELKKQIEEKKSIKESAEKGYLELA